MCKKYSPNRIYSSLKVWNKIVEDCSDAGMEEHSRNATVARFKWLYGDLKLMFKDDYDDKGIHENSSMHHASDRNNWNKRVWKVRRTRYLPVFALLI